MKCSQCFRLSDDCVLIDIRWGKHRTDWYVDHMVCSKCREVLRGVWQHVRKKKAVVKMWAVKFPERLGCPCFSPKWLETSKHKVLQEFIHGFGCSPTQEAKEAGEKTACEIVRVEVREI